LFRDDRDGQFADKAKVGDVRRFAELPRMSQDTVREDAHMREQEAKKKKKCNQTLSFLALSVPIQKAKCCPFLPALSALVLQLFAPSASSK
jgi:hypothetical protein